MHRWIGKFVGLFAIATALWSWPAYAGTERCTGQILAMSYNIRLDTPADGDNGWSHRRDFLIGQIQMLRPALLGMQEVLPGQRSDIQQLLDGYQLVGGGRDDGKLAGEASPIAVDSNLFRIESSGTFWLSPTPLVPSVGWDAALPRIATWAHVRHRQSGAKLLVINTHWDHKGLQARIESGKQLGQWILDHRQANEAVVLLGDFNTDSDTPAITEMTGMAGLRSALAALDSGTGAERPSSFNGFEALPQPGTVIDHIFVSESVAVVRAMVIAQHWNGRVASDHFPLAAVLAIPERSGKRTCS